MERGSFGDIDRIIYHHRLNVHFIIYIYEKYSYHLNLEAKTTMILTLMMDVELEHKCMYRTRLYKPQLILNLN
jgi:hypothetical protein